MFCELDWFRGEGEGFRLGFEWEPTEREWRLTTKAKAKWYIGRVDREKACGKREKGKSFV
jgi:hypothetical protein